jgi:hypothetical protein
VIEEVSDEYCEYCADNVPPKGYWRCPVCDAEWPDDEPLPTPLAPKEGGGV